MLPLVWAAHTGRLPRRARGAGPVARRRRAWGLVAVWGIAPINAIPRIADAAPTVVSTCIVAAGALAVAGSLLIATASRADAVAPAASFTSEVKG